MKKMKEKESINRQPFAPPGNIGAPPFRVLTPTQAGQYKDQQTQSLDGKMIGIIPMQMNQGAMMMGIKKPEEMKGQQGIAMQKGMPMPVMMSAGGMNPQMMAAMMGGGSMPSGFQLLPMGNGMQAFVVPADKAQQGQAGMPQGMPQGMTGIAMSPMGAMGAMGGIPNMAGMAGMNMMPMMMGGGGSGMPQGFMMPASMLQNQAAQNAAAEKAKAAELDKQKHA